MSFDIFSFFFCPKNFLQFILLDQFFVKIQSILFESKGLSLQKRLIWNLYKTKSGTNSRETKFLRDLQHRRDSWAHRKLICRCSQSQNCGILWFLIIYNSQANYLRNLVLTLTFQMCKIPFRGTVLNQWDQQRLEPDERSGTSTSSWLAVCLCVGCRLSTLKRHFHRRIMNYRTS